MLLLHTHEHIQPRAQAQRVVELHADILLVEYGHEVLEAAYVQLEGLGHELRAVELRKALAHAVHGVIQVVNPVHIRLVGRSVEARQRLRSLAEGEVEGHDVRHVLERAPDLRKILRRGLVGEVYALLPAALEG